MAFILLYIMTTSRHVHTLHSSTVLSFSVESRGSSATATNTSTIDHQNPVSNTVFLQWQNGGMVIGSTTAAIFYWWRQKQHLTKIPRGLQRTCHLMQGRSKQPNEAIRLESLVNVMSEGAAKPQRCGTIYMNESGLLSDVCS